MSWRFVNTWNGKSLTKLEKNWLARNSPWCQQGNKRTMKRKTKIQKYLKITLSGPQEEWGRNSHPLWTSHRERTWVSELKLGRISYGKEVKHWDKVLREVGNDSSLCSRDNAFKNILYLLDSFEIVGQLDWMNMHISSNANILFHSVWFLL